MKIVFYPAIDEGNKYITIIIEGLKKKGFTLISTDNFFPNYKRAKIIHLNWYENIFGYREFLEKITNLFLFRILGKKIIWTMHNRMPHENEHACLQRIFMYFLMWFSSRIIIHSLDSRVLLQNKSRRIGEKAVYLAHPNYIDLYGPLKEGDGALETHNTELNLLFVGMIRPYKNLELLIDCANGFGDRLRLTIAGRVLDKSYAAKIKKLASGNKNVKLDLTYIEDYKLTKYLYENDLVVLPYDLKSSLNSGTVILSFSYGRSVVCPNIGTINDIKDKSKILNYSYTTEKEHIRMLTETIDEAIELKQNYPNVFEQWGLQMRNYVMEHNGQDAFVDELANMYHEVTR